MTGEPLLRTVTITNMQGLHMRPITAFVELAGQYQSVIHVLKDSERFSARSPLTLLGLAAEKGTKLTLEVVGPDQAEAMEALVAFLDGLGSAEDVSA